MGEEQQQGQQRMGEERRRMEEEQQYGQQRMGEELRRMGEEQEHGRRMGEEQEQGQQRMEEEQPAHHPPSRVIIHPPSRPITHAGGGLSSKSLLMVISGFRRAYVEAQVRPVGM